MIHRIISVKFGQVSNGNEIINVFFYYKSLNRATI